MLCFTRPDFWPCPQAGWLSVTVACAGSPSSSEFWPPPGCVWLAKGLEKGSKMAVEAVCWRGHLKLWLKSSNPARFWVPASAVLSERWFCTWGGVQTPPLQTRGGHRPQEPNKKLVLRAGNNNISGIFSRQFFKKSCMKTQFLVLLKPNEFLSLRATIFFRGEGSRPTLLPPRSFNTLVVGVNVVGCQRQGPFARRLGEGRTGKYVVEQWWYGAGRHYPPPGNCHA